MRRRGGPALGCVAIAVVLAVAPAAGAQSPADVLLDDIGAGWNPTPCQVAPPAGGASVCFAGSPSGRFLQITATPVPIGIDARAFADQLASAYTGTPTFPTAGLDAAHGFALAVGGTDAYTLVLAGAHHVFNIGFIPYEPPSTATAFLLDIGRRQQQRDSGAPPASAPSVDPQEEDALERLLVTLPPSSGFVDVDTSTQRQTYDDLRDRARSQRVIDLLNDQPVATRIFRSIGDAVLVVSVAKHPYDSSRQRSSARSRAAAPSSTPTRWPASPTAWRSGWAAPTSRPPPSGEGRTWRWSCSRRRGRRRPTSPASSRRSRRCRSRSCPPDRAARTRSRRSPSR